MLARLRDARVGVSPTRATLLLPRRPRRESAANPPRIRRGSGADRRGPTPVRRRPASDL